MACTNLVFGLPAMGYVSGLDNKLVILTAVVVSFLMHISERKHQLPGLYPFNQWTQVFLNLDRVVAVFLSSYMVYLFHVQYIRDWEITAHLVCPSDGSDIACIMADRIIIASVALAGIQLQTVSESITTIMGPLGEHTRKGLLTYVICHSLWHLIAYGIMACLL